MYCRTMSHYYAYSLVEGEEPPIMSPITSWLGYATQK